MGKTSPEIRHRVRALGLRIVELEAGGAGAHPALSAVLTELRTEQSTWRLLLATRRIQARDRVVDLGRWRDGWLATPPAAALPLEARPAPRLERRGE